MRHGETAWNHDGNRYCGRTDILLSERGQIQADTAAAYLQQSNLTFEAVYASTLQRAVDTAKPLAQLYDLPVVTDERLVEADFGQWEGLRGSEIQLRDPDGFRQWKEDPAHTAAGATGETGTQIFTRMDQFFKEAASRYSQGRVLVISHSTAIRIYIAGMLSMPLRSYRQLYVANAALSVFESSDDGMRLTQFNGQIGSNLPDL